MKRNGKMTPFPNALISPPACSVVTDRGSSGKYAEEAGHRETLAASGWDELEPWRRRCLA